jgi:hypothetical protein
VEDEIEIEDSESDKTGGGYFKEINRYIVSLAGFEISELDFL